MTLQELLPKLKEAAGARELLTEEVKEFYRAETNPEERAMIYSDLREIARKNRFTKAFDTAFSAFKKDLEAAERALLAYERECRRMEKGDRNVNIDTVSKELLDLGIAVRYNQLLKEIEVTGLPCYYSKENAANILPIFLRDHMKACEYEGATVLNIEGCLNCIADRNRYNPIKEYLLSGDWDGVDRFPEIYRILGVTTYRHQTYIKKWFIQCIALGLNDEDEKPVGAEGVLVLQGEQGLAKTSFFRIMTPFPRWFVEGAIIDMRDKDSQIKALRGWIAELGELDSTIKKEQSSLKAFVTSPEDRIRLPYARSETRSPRRTSFCGTVNPKEYLKDETGSRRFWTVPLQSVDKKALFSMKRDQINQLWFQTYQLYLENPNGFRMTDSEIRELQADNEEFEQPLPYEMEIIEKLDFALPVWKWEWWSAVELCNFLPGATDARKVGRALSKITKNLHHTTPRTSKTVHGTLKYLIPLQSFDRSCRDQGGDGRVKEELPL